MDPQNPQSEQLPPQTPDLPEDKGNKLLLIIIGILFSLILAMVGYLVLQHFLRTRMIQTQQRSLIRLKIPSVSPLKKSLSPSTIPSPIQAVITWPYVSFYNSVIFIGQKYTLNIAESNGRNIKPFNEEITQNYQFINVPLFSSVSPDFSKLLIRPSKRNSEINDYYIVSMDGSKVHKIDTKQITDKLGEQYEINFRLWTLDAKRLGFIARDVKNFLDDRCCEGGDYRASKQIIGTLNIETLEVKELTTITASPIEFIFFDPAKNIIAYSDEQYGGGRIHTLNLTTGEETSHQTMTILNYYGNGTYFVGGESDSNGSRRLMIYSIYETSKPSAEIAIDNDNNRFSNWVVWSPDNSKFAIKIFNVDNSYNDEVKIYDLRGNLINTIHTYFGDGSVFSHDSSYILSVISRNVNGVYSSSWETINISTGEKSPETTSSDLGTVLFWFLH